MRHNFASSPARAAFSLSATFLLASLSLACGSGSSDDQTATGGTASGGSPSGGATSNGTGSTGTSSGGAATGGSTAIVIGDNPEAKSATALTIDDSDEKQEIDGFGTSTAWGSTPSDENFDALFSKSKGAGLTIVRNRIPFREAPTNNDNFMGGGTYTSTVVNSGTANQYKKFTLNWENWDLKKTKALIEKVNSSTDYEIAHYFSTPWTPPNNNTSKWKLGVSDPVNHPEVGGYLDPTHYADYADVLADYALEFETKMGAPLSALSLQNEPNYKVDYESADWSAEQFKAFTAVLKAEFEKKGVLTTLPELRVMAPEDPNYKEDLIVPTLNDANLVSMIGIVGAHQYEFGPWNESSYVPSPFSTALEKGKRVWMTEWNSSAFSSSSELEHALRLGRLIDMDLSLTSMNAFVYWWYADLVDNAAVPRKLLWVLGQYSRYVRPGAVRLGQSGALGDNVRASSFRSPDSTEFITVVVNESDADVTFALDLGVAGLGDVQVIRTSESENLTDVGSVSGGYHYVNVTAAKKSVTTFVAPLLR